MAAGGNGVEGNPERNEPADDLPGHSFRCGGGWWQAGAVALFLLVTIRTFGMIQFGGLDGGAVSQAGWRQYLGQVPYVDYSAVCPPSYIVLPGLAYDLLGVHWSSIVWLGALFSAGAFLFQFWLFRQLRFPVVWSLLISFTTQAVTMLPLGWWSYNQTASVAGVLFVAAAFLLLLEPERWAVRIAFVAAMAGLSWMKPNVAGLLLAGFAILFLGSRRARWTYLACACAATLLSISAMVVSGVDPRNLLQSYLGSSGRLLSIYMAGYCLFRSEMDEAVTCFLLLIPIALALVMAAEWPTREHRVFLWASLLAMAAGFFGMATNNDFNSADVPLVLTGAIFILFNPATQCAPAAQIPPGPRFDRRSLRGGLTLLTLGSFSVVGLLYCLTRYRIESIGTATFFQGRETLPVTSPPFFQGVEGSARLIESLQEINQILAQTNAATACPDSIFLGPRLEAGYPAFHIVPHRGLFLWWPGTGESMTAEIDKVDQNFEQWRPRLCIFVKDDYTYIPADLLRFFLQEYQFRSTENLTVLTLKSPQAAKPEPPPK